MPSRGQITNVWFRVCINCGHRRHTNAIKRDNKCPKCGDNRWTRDKTKVEA